ncbi:MAG TPA: hypothetical protein VMF09_05970 [Solirubrobacteraceae bacterium]|nr:hypothetical protein [Solirubrobacteraceae bacterium]
MRIKTSRGGAATPESFGVLGMIFATDQPVFGALTRERFGCEPTTRACSTTSRPDPIPTGRASPRQTSVMLDLSSRNGSLPTCP